MVGQPIGAVGRAGRWSCLWATASVPPSAISAIASPPAAPIPASPQSNPLGVLTCTIVGTGPGLVNGCGSGPGGRAEAVLAVSVSRTAVSASARSALCSQLNRSAVRDEWFVLGTSLACLSVGWLVGW
jgi:hypothetical protein